MRIELQKQLSDRYPLTLRTRGPYPLAVYGIECGDGWFKILDDLLGKFETYAQAREASGIARSRLPYAAQVKEKMGTLRVYVRMRETVAELERALESAEAQSCTTCESCGAPGVGRNEGGWLRVSCDACEAQPRPEVTAEEIEAYEKALKTMLRGRK